MKRLPVLALTVIVIFSTVHVCYGYVAAPIDVRSLTGKADFVCKGEVETITSAGLDEITLGGQQSKVHRMNATFRVDRAIKDGVSSDRVQIEFFVSVLGRGPKFDDLQDGEYCILFLRKKGTLYQFVDPYNGKLPISRTVAQNVADQDDPLERMKEELLVSCRDSQKTVALAAIEQLGNLGMKQVVPVLKDFEANTNLELRGESLLSRLKLSDPSALAAAMNYIESAVPMNLTEPIKAKIYHAIGKLNDPVFRQPLEALITHTDTSLRRNVAEGLRNIESELSTSCLIQALDDEHSEVKYNVLMALASIHNKKEGDWAPAYKTFLENESEFISLWEDWWTTEGSQRFGN